MENELNPYVEEVEIVVDPGQSLIRIDKFLFDKLEKTSRNRIQNAVKKGSVLVDGKSIKSNHKVKPGEIIHLFIPRSQASLEPTKPQDIPLDIIYEDQYLMVVNKSAGMVVHPGFGNRDGTMVNALLYYLNKSMPVMEGNSLDRPGIVHRIDKNTSGLLVVAKEENTMTHLASQFFNHSIERSYQALVWGSLDPQEGTINRNIGRDPRFRKKMAILDDGEGKVAITHYKTLEDLYYISSIECRLETGRTHQIRVHLSAQGNPIFNDNTYGGDSIRKGTVFTKYKQFVENCFTLCPRHALHARSLGFIHPITGERMDFTQEIPEDMRKLYDKWKAYLTTKNLHN